MYGRLAALAHAQVEHLDEDRERHREIDVALWDVLSETFGDEHRANQQEKAEREHFDGWMALDEAAHRARRKYHKADGDHHRRDHHDDLVNHSNRCNHRIERENYVEQRDLNEDARKRRRGARRAVLLRAFEGAMNLMRRFAEDRKS